MDGPGEPLVVGHGIVQAGLVHGEHHTAIGVLKMDAAGLQLALAVLENLDFLGAT